MKKLTTLIAMVAMAGIVSAAVIVDEDFSYADGTMANAAVNAGTGLTGTFAESWGSGAFSGGAATSMGSMTATVSNPITDNIGSGREFWVSYRYQQNGYAYPAGGAGAGLGFGEFTYRGAFFKIADDGIQSGNGFDYQEAVATVQLGDWSYKSTTVLFETGTSANQDLFIIGKVVLDTTPHISMAVYDWANKPTSEASIVWDIDVDYGGGWADSASGDYGLLVMNQSGQANDVKFDNTLLGDTAADIGVIPEPATLGLVATFAGMALFIRRRLMM